MTNLFAHEFYFLKNNFFSNKKKLKLNKILKRKENLESLVIFRSHSQFRNKILTLTEDRKIKATLTFINDIFFFLHRRYSLVVHWNVVEGYVANNDVQNGGAGGNVELGGG